MIYDRILQDLIRNRLIIIHTLHYISPHSRHPREVLLAPDAVKGYIKPTGDFNNQLRSIVGASGDVLDLPQCEHAIDDFSKHDVFSVQKIALCGGYKELVCLSKSIS